MYREQRDGGVVAGDLARKIKQRRNREQSRLNKDQVIERFAVGADVKLATVNTERHDMKLERPFRVDSCTLHTPLSANDRTWISGVRPI
ncbi:hypothetical protein [Paraburkholderia sp. RAU2J]|uniref:hypothetical protein n=1 Tax=Paraburkholderia sp. RAU2J TaxID=1938810 RepID=UPI0011C409A9|nr:hypothetical protein [Paraburkholderia sp. RAU2J]